MARDVEGADLVFKEEVGLELLRSTAIAFEDLLAVFADPLGLVLGDFLNLAAIKVNIEKAAFRPCLLELPSQQTSLSPGTDCLQDHLEVLVRLATPSCMSIRMRPGSKA